MIDAKVHAITEGVGWISNQSTWPMRIYVCVDNQTALKALSGGKCTVKEDLKQCQGGFMVLRQSG